MDRPRYWFAAKELGLSRMGLRQKLARFGLEGQADG